MHTCEEILNSSNERFSISWCYQVRFSLHDKTKKKGFEDTDNLFVIQNETYHF